MRLPSFGRNGSIHFYVLTTFKFPAFRPKKVFCFILRILADGNSSEFITQGYVSDRSSRNFTLGYVILAFQA